MIVERAAQDGRVLLAPIILISLRRPDSILAELDLFDVVAEVALLPPSLLFCLVPTPFHDRRLAACAYAWLT